MDIQPIDLYNLFKRTIMPTVSTLRKICDALGISMAYFYSAENDIFNLEGQQKRIFFIRQEVLIEKRHPRGFL